MKRELRTLNEMMEEMDAIVAERKALIRQLKDTERSLRMKTVKESINASIAETAVKIGQMPAVNI